jgi:hypothetical protein
LNGAASIYLNVSTVSRGEFRSFKGFSNALTRPLSPADLVKAIMDTEPPRPSDAILSTESRAVAKLRGATPEKLRRQLRGDLDTILGKMFSREPSLSPSDGRFQETNIMKSSEWISKELRHAMFRALSFALICVSVLGMAARDAAGATIYVTTLEQKITTSGGCSLQEAIYSSVFHDSLDGGAHGIAIDATDPDHFITTDCVMGSGNDTIVLPTNGVLKMSNLIDGDAYNPYGPTATPLIFSTITIEGHGATLQWDSTATGNVRLFAIGALSIKTPNGTASGTGNLTLRNAYIKGFHAKGGDGKNGGGGGLGAGGAIYLQNSTLTVENSTFDGNQATGGQGGDGGNCPGDIPAGGGGGGLGGNGGCGAGFSFGGGGGGGARGDGGSAFGPKGDGGAGGGGTVFAGGYSQDRSYVGGAGGYLCGGNGGDASDDGNDGHNGKCPGGGGGGAGPAINNNINLLPSNTGGRGNYGGGGGGSAGAWGHNNGGDGGFGGGGGGAADSAGNGGFGGGGGGAGAGGNGSGGSSGKGGAFGGNGESGSGGGGFGGGGGGGGALGGAIFSDTGTVTVRNSTFTNNVAVRGDGGVNCWSSCIRAASGGDAGGAIFSLDNTLEITDSTFSGNQSTGSGAAIVVYSDEGDAGIEGGGGAPVNFQLYNTLIANNGANECFFTNKMNVQGAGNLIMNNGSGTGPFGACPGVVTTSDPQLGPLQPPIVNGGKTPTMAIAIGSSAMGTADSATSLAYDQRYADRPQPDSSPRNGYDIGAFEVCRRFVAGHLEPTFCSETHITLPSTQTLTIKSTSTTGGTVSPAPGSYNVESDSVVVLTATPNLAYCFTGWTGNVALPSSTQTTVVMNQAQSVTANFAQCDFSFSPIPAFTIPLDGSGSATVTVNSLGIFDQTVKLAVSAPPAGVTASLSAVSVKPAAGGSIGETLSVGIGPSVTPQSFALTVTGTSGALTHSVATTVTVQATTAGITNVINQDRTLGCIDNSGIGQSLLAKINAYQTLASGGHTQGATNLLTAFQHEVLAQTGQHIATTCTDPIGGNQFSTGGALIADAQSLQASLGAQVKPNPIVGSVLNSGNVGISRSTVNTLSSKTVIATTTTDAVGFYYFADASGLTLGANYTVHVTLPKGYKTSTPASQTFTW